VRILIDTHALLWYVDQDHLLSTKAHAEITDPNNDLFVSAATIWEIAIKVGIGKLTLTGPYRPWMDKALSDLGAVLLPITVVYADILVSLPALHRDPFDRLIVAQSLNDSIPIVSGDVLLDGYGITRIW
jgi:PIN domain nuclease of toxin-antitoxin system